MKIRRQSEVLPKLETEIRRAMRAHEDDALRGLQSDWTWAKDAISGALLGQYHKDFPRQKWNFTDAQFKGTLSRMNDAIAYYMDWFKRTSTARIRSALRTARDEEVKRTLWMIDQVTPPHISPKAPKAGYREASAPDWTTTTTWSQRWGESVDAYTSTLQQNIRLGSINLSDAADVADEVEATKFGTPAAYMDDSMKRMFISAYVQESQLARDEVVDENDDIIEEEIWQTMEDASVCYICDDLFGMTREEVEAGGADDEPGFIHPNDRCFYRIVPKAWAELLRSGDADAREQALQMDDEGLSIDSMAIRNADGELVGRVTIPFEKWNPAIEKERYEKWKQAYQAEYLSKGELQNQWNESMGSR
jgi:hypothetical protein